MPAPVPPSFLSWPLSRCGRIRDPAPRRRWELEVFPSPASGRRGTPNSLRRFCEGAALGSQHIGPAKRDLDSRLPRRHSRCQGPSASLARQRRPWTQLPQNSKAFFKVGEFFSLNRVTSLTRLPSASALTRRARVDTRGRRFNALQSRTRSGTAAASRPAGSQFLRSGAGISG